jgi:serine/threonine protein kinase
MKQTTDILLYCAPQDEELLKGLERQLYPLARTGAIRLWPPIVEAGLERAKVLEEQLGKAAIAVFIVSADFFPNEECERLLTLALSCRDRRGLRIIPIIGRACDYENTLLGRLQPLPCSRRPIASYTNQDDAWAEVILEIKKLLHLPAQEIPRPEYRDAERKTSCQELDQLRTRRETLRQRGLNTDELDRRITEFRRRLREGGLQPGDRLGDGRYLLMNELERGGFAVVWKAFDEERGELVAVKVLHAHLAGDSIQLERFRRGAREMAELSHQNIVRIFDRRGEDNGYHFFVMELLTGGDLRRSILEESVGVPGLYDIIIRIGEALGYAHNKGLVHRDVKPANILLDATGQPKLTDFDLVAVKDTTGGTRTGALGTIIYAAPECVERPQDANARADVYGLAMTALMGIRRAEPSIWDLGRLDRIIDRAACHRAVKDVLKKALNIRKEDRFADATAFSEALRSAAQAANEAPTSIKRSWGPHSCSEAPIPPSGSWNPHAPFSEPGYLERWTGEYSYVEWAPGIVVGYTVVIERSATGQYLAQVNVDGYQSMARMTCSALLSAPDRMECYLIEVGEDSVSHPTKKKGDLVLSLRRDIDGSVEFIWGILQANMPTAFEYVEQDDRDFLSLPEITSRLALLLEKDYGRFVECQRGGGTREGSCIVLTGSVFPIRYADRRYVVVYDVGLDKLHVLLSDRTAGQVDIWSEDWTTIPALVQRQLEELSLQDEFEAAQPLPVLRHRD